MAIPAWQTGYKKNLKIEHRATCLCKICKYFPGKYFDSVN